MQLLRSHIIKWCFICLIGTGFGLYMVQPAYAQHTSRSFSAWIGTVVDESQAGDLREELEKMRTSGADIYKLMRHASQMMSEADRQFNLPLKNASEVADATNHILHILLQQWNHFRTGSGMASVPPPEIVKTQVAITLDKYGTPASAITYSSGIPGLNNFTADKKWQGSSYCCQLEPMSMGIAIGAP